MAVSGRAVHKNHNPTLYIYIVISPLPFIFFIMDSCLCHIMESTKWIEIKLGTYYINRCYWEEVQKTRTIILSYILLELSLFITFHKRWFSLSCLGVQVVFDYTICLLKKIGTWGTFLDSRHVLVCFGGFLSKESFISQCVSSTSKNDHNF